MNSTLCLCPLSRGAETVPSLVSHCSQSHGAEPVPNPSAVRSKSLAALSLICPVSSHYVRAH